MRFRNFRTTALSHAKKAVAKAAAPVFSGAPGPVRTADTRSRKAAPYPLSYGGAQTYPAPRHCQLTRTPKYCQDSFALKQKPASALLSKRWRKSRRCEIQDSTNTVPHALHLYSLGLLGLPVFLPTNSDCIWGNLGAGRRSNSYSLCRRRLPPPPPAVAQVPSFVSLYLPQPWSCTAQTAGEVEPSSD